MPRVIRLRQTRRRVTAQQTRHHRHRGRCGRRLVYISIRLRRDRQSSLIDHTRRILRRRRH